MRKGAFARIWPGALLPAFALSACAAVQAPPRPFYPAVDVMASGETAPVGTAAADAAAAAEQAAADAAIASGAVQG